MSDIIQTLCIITKEVYEIDCYLLPPPDEHNFALGLVIRYKDMYIFSVITMNNHYAGGYSYQTTANLLDKKVKAAKEEMRKVMKEIDERS